MSGVEDRGAGRLDRSVEFRYCPHCGARLVRDGSVPAGGQEPARPRCPACGYVHYLNPITVVAAVLLSDGAHLPPPGEAVSPARASHLLLVRRAVTYPGTWCIPCGYVDYHEDIRVAAAREMREETALAVDIGEDFAVHSNFHNPRNHTVGVWFLTRYLSGELAAGDDADRAVFARIDQPEEPLAFPTDRRVIADLRALAR